MVVNALSWPRNNAAIHSTLSIGINPLYRAASAPLNHDLRPTLPAERCHTLHLGRWYQPLCRAAFAPFDHDLLLTLVKVSGCSTPSTHSLLSKSRRCSFSAASYLPWYRSTNARLSTLANVDGCSTPSTFSLPSRTRRCSFSATSDFPWSPSTDARLLTLVNVSGCSSPSTLFLISITCTFSSSASFHRP